MSKLDPLKCGGCGHALFKLSYSPQKGEVRFGGGPIASGSLHVECAMCGDKSQIKPSPGSFDVDPEGTLCGGWGGRTG